MAFLTALSQAAASAIAREYGVELSTLEALDAGSVNSNFRLVSAGGRSLFARIYEEQGFEGAERELRLGRELARAGVPVAVALEKTAGGALAEHAGKPVALFEWVDGEILCQARVTPGACRRVGAALAKVHAASSRVAPPGAGRFNVKDLQERLGRVEREASPELQSAARALGPELSKYAAARDASLPSGLIHGDLFRDNVLWQNGEIVALLDFESASHGPFAYDVAVTLHAWCFGAHFEPELVAELLAGYQAHRPLERRELDAFKAEAALAALRFCVTRLTDYSMRAPPGTLPIRDYRRFVARLRAVESGAFDAALAQLESAS